jgi:hypothetical protein
MEGRALQVVQDMRRRADTVAERDSAVREINYFRNNLSRMDYDTYKAQGFPIGSGLVEGFGGDRAVDVGIIIDSPGRRKEYGMFSNHPVHKALGGFPEPRVLQTTKNEAFDSIHPESHFLCRRGC